MNQTITKVGGARLSNYELLRLLCMLMVLNLHSFSGYGHGTGLAQALDFLRESTSICAVDTFILISGFFGIKWRKKGCFNLLFQVLYYSFVVYGVSVALGFIQFEKGEFIHCFKAFYDSWSFITFYIVLYFISPWLNAFAEKCDKRQLLYFILIFYIAEIVIMRSTGFLNYCLIYLIGRWLSKINIVRLSDKAVVGYIVTTFLIFFCSYSAYRLLHLDAEGMHDFILGYSYASPFVILQAVFLFLAFSKIKIQSKWINWCAASCLSIFLIHMHPAIKGIGYYGYTASLYEKPLLEHIVSLLCLMLFVFFGAILIDKIRIVVSDLVYRLISRGWKVTKGDLIMQRIKSSISFNGI